MMLPEMAWPPNTREIFFFCRVEIRSRLFLHQITFFRQPIYRQLRNAIFITLTEFERFVAFY